MTIIFAPEFLRESKALYDLLMQIYAEYGFSKEFTVNVVRPGKTGADEIKQMMVNYRQNPPKTLGGSKVVAIKDYSDLNEYNLVSGDFYAFRDLGITVYQRTLYRNSPTKVDSCFFTSTGDMLFARAGELTGEGETQKFIEARIINANNPADIAMVFSFNDYLRFVDMA